MKKIFRISVTAAMLVVFLAASSQAEDKTVLYRNAKTIGMGDARVAGGLGYNGFIYNPALLGRVEHFRLSLLTLPITINENTRDVAKFIDDNKEKFEDFDNLTSQEKVKFLNDVQKYGNKWSRLNVSPMFNAAFSAFGQSFGIALYNTTDIDLKIDRGIYEPRVWGQGKSAFVANLAYARPLLLVPGLTVGANLKLIQRRNASLFQIKASDLGNMQDTMEPVNDEIKNEKHNTFAIDLGALYEIPIIDSEVGAVIQSLGDGRGASVDLGIAKRLLEDNLILLADYVDFLDNNKENVFTKLHFGGQYNLQMLKLRAGINSGYPTLGLGLNFKIIDIDAAYFFDEMGNAPGMDEDERYLIQFKLGW